MICTTTTLTVHCESCGDGLTANPAEPAGRAALFADRIAALMALGDAFKTGWEVRNDRLLCPPCTARALCAMYGHEFRNCTENGPHSTGEDGTGGWRYCACDRSIPAHREVEPDPAGGPGCGMARLCGRCDHIDEQQVTALTTTVQPDGHLRQDVPAGLAPNRHQDSKETPMVEPTRTSTADPAPATASGGVR